MGGTPIVIGNLKSRYKGIIPYYKRADGGDKTKGGKGKINNQGEACKAWNFAKNSRNMVVELKVKENLTANGWEVKNCVAKKEDPTIAVVTFPAHRGHGRRVRKINASIVRRGSLNDTYFFEISQIGRNGKPVKAGRSFSIRLKPNSRLRRELSKVLPRKITRECNRNDGVLETKEIIVKRGLKYRGIDGKMHKKDLTRSEVTKRGQLDWMVKYIYRR